MKHLSLIAVGALASLAASQTVQTLPKGMATTRGSASFWSGLDTFGTTTFSYAPARNVHLYDKADFPWTGAKTLTKLTGRRDELSSTRTTTVSSARMRLYMSYSGHAPRRPHTGDFDKNHGTGLKMVLGTVAAPKVINFPSTPRPTTGVAPFNLVLALDSAFTVPATATNLVLEVRNYGFSALASSLARYRVDAKNYSRGYNGGRQILIGATVPRCDSPRWTYWFFPAHAGSQLTIQRDTRRSGNVAVGWVGFRRKTSIAIAGTGTPSVPCRLFVDGVIFKAALAGTFSAGRATMIMGDIPDIPAAVGFKVSHQMLVLDPSLSSALKLQFGVGVEQSIGSGYPPTTLGSVVFSYGTNTTSTLPKVDPDKEKAPKYLTGYAVIWKIN